MTIQELQNLDPKKIYSITQKTSALSSMCLNKVYRNIDIWGKDKGFIVATREGILKYFGNAQYCAMYGTKNIHYKEFKTASGVYKFLQKSNSKK